MEDDYCDSLFSNDHPKGQGIVAGGCVRNIQTFPLWFHWRPAEIIVLLFEPDQDREKSISNGIYLSGHPRIRKATNLHDFGFSMKKPAPIIICSTNCANDEQRLFLRQLICNARALARYQLLLTGSAASISKFTQGESPLLALGLGLHDLTFCDSLQLDNVNIEYATKTAMEVFASRRAEAIQADGIAATFHI